MSVGIQYPYTLITDWVIFFLDSDIDRKGLKCFPPSNPSLKIEDIFFSNTRGTPLYLLFFPSHYPKRGGSSPFLLFLKEERSLFTVSRRLRNRMWGPHNFVFPIIIQVYSLQFLDLKFEETVFYVILRPNSRLTWKRYTSSFPTLKVTVYTSDVITYRSLT